MPQQGLPTRWGAGLLAENAALQNTKAESADLAAHGNLKLHAMSATTTVGISTITLHPLVVSQVNPGPTTMTVGAISAQSATSGGFVWTVAPAASDSRALLGVWASQVGAWTVGANASGTLKVTNASTDSLFLSGGTIGAMTGNISNALTIVGSTISAIVTGQSLAVSGTPSVNVNNSITLTSFGGVAASAFTTSAPTSGFLVADLGVPQGSPAAFAVAASTHNRQIFTATANARACIVRNVGGVNIYLGAFTLVGSNATASDTVTATVTTSSGGSTATVITGSGNPAGFLLAPGDIAALPWTAPIYMAVSNSAQTGSCVTWGGG